MSTRNGMMGVGNGRPKALAVGGAPFLTTIFPEEITERLARSVEMSRPVSTPELLGHPELLAEVEYLFTTWGVPKLEEETLCHAPKLRAVLHVAGSVRRIATDALWRRGIVLTSSYAINAIPTAEFALAAILLANKRAWHHAVSAKLNRSQAPADFQGRSRGAGNYGSVVGLLSYGAVARELRRLLRNFQIRVLVCDPFLKPERAMQDEMTLVGMDELFSTADVVSVHTPLLPETTGLVGREHLMRLKPYASFINTSRGAIVDERALIDVLKERPDLQAILDVTFPEPPEPESPLYALPNVILTPHLAGSLGRECGRMSEAMVTELERMIAGHPLRWQITREHLVSMA
jgi:phosphoglycerate dehydrogenase-like enzyme